MVRARTNAERSRATTEQLVSVARDLFAADGYDATFLDAVVERAGVTKGALYHHFGGKRDLFEAVYAAEQSAIEQRIYGVTVDISDSWEAFCTGCEAFFGGALDSGFQQILTDAPAVLGWTAMREIEDRHLMALLKLGLTRVINDGHIKSRRIEPLAHQIHGAMCEAAMVIARSDDPEQEVAEATSALNDLLSGLTTR